MSSEQNTQISRLAAKKCGQSPLTLKKLNEYGKKIKGYKRNQSR